eukprot:384656-Rhodomonas_salina.2
MAALSENMLYNHEHLMGTDLARAPGRQTGQTSSDPSVRCCADTERHRRAHTDSTSDHRGQASMHGGIVPATQARARGVRLSADIIYAAARWLTSAAYPSSQSSR